ncbi:MAG: hypothetical protein ABEN55_04080 [Bradymonadaceae bacterium]
MSFESILGLDLSIFSMAFSHRICQRHTPIAGVEVDRLDVDVVDVPVSHGHIFYVVLGHPKYLSVGIPIFKGVADAFLAIELSDVNWRDAHLGAVGRKIFEFIDVIER